MALTDETPFHLAGNFAPVSDEITATNLEVIGQIPVELEGSYLRNGANPITGESAHWFLGDGMVHGVRLSGGKAEWYRNRYVRTPFYDEPTKPVIDMETFEFNSADSKANTHVVGHAGRILTFEEGHLPYELTPELDTIGPVTFDGKLDGAFTAHPKICPLTGEMLGFGYGVMPPYLTYLRVSADGDLVQKEEIEIPAPVMMHDFNITQNHVVFMDLPVVFDLELALQGTMPFQFQRENGARLGVLPRTGTADQIRWFDIDPCYVFHPVNSFEDGGRIILDVARYPSMWEADASFQTAASLWRWTIDLENGSVTETQLDDRAIEFGRVSDDHVALDYRYGYAVGNRGDANDPDSTTIVKFDMQSDSSAPYDLGAGRQPGEFVFVGRPGATAEDDGWLMGYVYDRAEDRSDLVILDATDPTADAVAVVKLPRRVPFGFHGSWVAD
ncbi:MAG: carotenoid oxygenase family protein [Actinomycetota bacterium]|jgi:carotenoid cleavage dioxygenase-like enzyme|nr:carotenoid oxygenase family protein [Actinomycetota bacterium]